MNRRTAALSTLAIAGACLAAFLCGCSPKNETIVLGFSQAGVEGTWRTANSESIKTAAQRSGIQLHFADAGAGQEDQIVALRSFIAKRVDVIAFTPVSETGWDAVLREAKKAGIPVVLTERTVQVGDRSLYTTMLGSDFVEQGRNAARWLLENTLGRSGQTNIVELLGTEGSLLSTDRGRGFHEVIDTDPHFQIVRAQAGNFTHAGGRAAMKALLAAEGKGIKVVYAHNDEMALGAIQALEEARLRPGKDITIISVDGIRGAFEAMVAGKLSVTVESNPLIGPQLMGVVKDVVAHRRLPHRLVVQEFVFPKESALEALPTRRY
ncbi:MAG: ABC transporter substrate-binding protein [Gammaproteobacteria bacterium]